MQFDIIPNSLPLVIRQIVNGGLKRVLLEVGIRKMSHRTETTSGRSAPAGSKALLLGAEFMVLCDTFEVEQVVKAVAVDVESVNLSSRDALTIGSPAHTELCPYWPEAPTRDPIRRFESFELGDLLRDLGVWRASLRRGGAYSRSGKARERL